MSAPPGENAARDGENTARDLVARLAADTSGWPPTELLRAIVDQGEAAEGPLRTIVEAYPGGDDPNGAIYLAAPLLALLGTPGAIAPLANLLRRADDDDNLVDWLTSWPTPLAALGPTMIPPLLDIARDNALPWYPRAMSSETAKTLAGDDPALRANVAAALRAALTEHVVRAEREAEEWDEEDEEMVGSLVCDLAEMADPDARSIIDAAFAADLVPEMFIGRDDVEEMYQKGGAPRGPEPSPTPEAARDVWLTWYAERRVSGLEEIEAEARREALREERLDLRGYIPDPDDLDAPDEPRQMPVRVEAKPGRNDPCWCGSGKKYKKCHLVADQGGAAT